MQRTTTYQEQSRAFMVEAFKELEKGDFGLAAEKGWAASAHIIKAIAQERGWAHDDPPDLHTVMDRIYLETEDSELDDLFCSAVFLGFSYYEGGVSAEYMEDTLRDVEQFVNRAERLLRSTS